jgi:phosphate-selective porin OprO/OprP
MCKVVGVVTCGLICIWALASAQAQYTPVYYYDPLPPAAPAHRAAWQADPPPGGSGPALSPPRATDDYIRQLEERVRALEKAASENNGSRQNGQQQESKEEDEKQQADEGKEKGEGEEKQQDDEPEVPELKEVELVEKPVVTPRARVHFDSAWFDQSERNRETLGDIENGVYFRRARLGANAKWYDIYSGRLDFELGDEGRPSLFDAYLAVSEIPFFGTVRAGHMREPWSLEAQTSSNWFTFIERGLQDPFDPSRNAGMMFENHAFNESLTYHAGVFRTTDAYGADIGDDGDWAWTHRYTWLPWYDEPSEGRYLLHLGMSHTWRDTDDGTIDYDSRPTRLREDGVGGTPNFVATGDIPADSVNQFGWEGSMNYGSLNVQAEYVMSHVDQIGGPELYFNGGYIQCSYFLTGEHRNYDRQMGYWAEQEVFTPFFCVRTPHGLCKGWGAWEVAARWSWIDLNDDNIQGGYLDASYVGLNWYLNTYMRVMFNYVHLELDDPDFGPSDCNLFLTRMMVWF